VFDLILRGGQIIDGSGSASFDADIGIQAGKISAIGDLSDSDDPSLDCGGSVATPGFIDIHSHSDFTLLVDPRARSQVAQGVTTEVIGNCGHGCAPITSPGRFKSNIYGHSEHLNINWNSTSEFLALMDQSNPAVNVATMIPNGNLRLAHVADLTRPSIPDELEAMDADLREGLDAGAFGFSTGLEYPAERSSSSAELESLSRTTASYGGMYVPHTRNRELFAVEAIQEAIDTATAAEIPLHISHILPRKGGPADSTERALELVDDANASGLDVTFDIHTREHGITNLSCALPDYELAMSADDRRANLGNASYRDAVRQHESIISSFGIGGWENVSIFTAPATPELEGVTLAQLSEADPFSAVCDVLAANADDLNNVMVLCHSYREEEIVGAASHPLCMVGSDATALATDGPIGESSFLGAYSWASWFIHKSVFDHRTLGLSEAIKRMTSMPAQRLGLNDRGELKVGNRADIAVFAPDEFSPTATLDNPNSYAIGMRHVIVNGIPSFADGEFTDDRNGQVLRKTS
jgi:N-acyl-D-aspartate/D-glutamate deacylase